jgi:hypothetical protein
MAAELRMAISLPEQTTASEKRMLDAPHQN